MLSVIKKMVPEPGNNRRALECGTIFLFYYFGTRPRLQKKKEKRKVKMSMEMSFGSRYSSLFFITNTALVLNGRSQSRNGIAISHQVERVINNVGKCASIS